MSLCRIRGRRPRRSTKGEQPCRSFSGNKRRRIHLYHVAPGSGIAIIRFKLDSDEKSLVDVYTKLCRTRQDPLASLTFGQTAVDRRCPSCHSHCGVKYMEVPLRRVASKYAKTQKKTRTCRIQHYRRTKRQIRIDMDPVQLRPTDIPPR